MPKKAAKNKDGTPKKPKVPKEKPPVIVKVDMPTQMQQDAIDCARLALSRFNQEKDIACFMKKEFDKKYNPTWQCIVGRNFGSHVSHQCRNYLYFFIDKVSVLLFRTC